MGKSKKIAGPGCWRGLPMALALAALALLILPVDRARAQSTSQGEKKEDAGSAKTVKKEDAGAAKTLKTEDKGPVKAEDAGQAKTAKTEDEGPAKTVKTYEMKNGSDTISRIEESERKKTADGETVTERVHLRGSDGDDRVLLEREIHTKNLPDGTIERETTLKNSDGNGGMQPIEITREKIRTEKSGSTVEREVEKPDMNGGWSTVQRQTERTTGTEDSKQTTKEVQAPTVNG